MRCPSCGEENRDDAAFCGSCGARLAAEVLCSACGRSNPSGRRFCDACGQELTAASPPPRPPATAPLAAVGMPSLFAGGRYQVQRFLGEGGKKRVYLARDARLDRDVALALIKTDGLDAEGLTRVRREAQAMGRLGDHTHIVTVFDIGDEGGQPYLVQEHMAGGDLGGLIDQAEQRRLPVGDALRIADEVCQALEHAHSRGIIHRDLKPGNIWLTQDGTSKIGDFGLAVALDRSRLTMAGMMVGTASYMPPEQAMGGEATQASDLYALGCVLYEMVTGRPPFVGDDTVAVISQHLNTAPVAPSWHSPECPPGLEALIMRLLEKDPELRPAGASEVRASLASVERHSTPAPAAAASEAVSNPIYRRTFVGREAELKQLEMAFDAALSGQGGLVMVVGEPGIGKTTLTEQLATYVGIRGGRTLVGHCYEEGSLSLPYLPFVEAMRTYTLSHEAGDLAEQLGSGAAEVARIVSEVRDKVRVELLPPGNPEEERFRLFQAVTAFLRNAAAVQALCIVLEDLHDADKGTMEMLVHVARNLAGARLLVVGTYRDVEVDRTHPLSAALAELRRVDSFARIPLRGLSPDEVQRMLSNIAGQDVPWPLAEAIYRQTEGNPLFTQEMVRYAVEEGLIRRESGQWVAAVDSLLTNIPEGLRDVIGRRLSRLSEGCNRVLAVAAVIGRDFPVDVLQMVAGVGEEDDWAEAVTLVTLLDAAVRLGDKKSAALLSKRMEDAAEWYVLGGLPFARPLGMASLLLGDPAGARQHLQTALEVAEKVQHGPEVARAHLELAGVIFEHYPEERAQAAEHLNFAVREFREMKMQPSLEEAMRLKLRFQGLTSSDVNTSIDRVATSVHAERPDLRPHAAPDGTVTILFSDIEGSTAMTDRLGDRRFMEVLRAHNGVVRQKVKAHAGFEVKSEGDGFMVVFQSARRALQCAIDIQRAFAQRNRSAEEPVRVRIGLHTGEAIKEGEDFFGKNVVLAARIAGQAQGGQILVSSLLRELTDSSGEFAFDGGREVELKGLSGLHKVFEVGWPEREAE